MPSAIWRNGSCEGRSSRPGCSDRSSWGIFEVRRADRRLFDQAPHRVLSDRLLRRGTGGRGRSYRVHRGHRRVPGVLEIRRERPVHPASGIRLCRSRAGRPLVPVRGPLAPACGRSWSPSRARRCRSGPFMRPIHAAVHASARRAGAGLMRQFAALGSVPPARRRFAYEKAHQATSDSPRSAGPRAAMPALPRCVRGPRQRPSLASPLPGPS